MLFKNHKQIVENGETPIIKEVRKDILDVLSYAVKSVDPYISVKRVIKDNIISLDEKKFNVSDFENVYLVGFGKASIGMSQAVCDSIKIKKGVIVTNDKNSKVEHEYISTYFGSHPIPDEGSIYAAEEILKLIKKTEENDLLIVLISGGGSALLCKPRVNLEDLQKTTDLLYTKIGGNTRKRTDTPFLLGFTIYLFD